LHNLHKNNSVIAQQYSGTGLDEGYHLDFEGMGFFAPRNAWKPV
jgi:hypothetical protein